MLAALLLGIACRTSAGQGADCPQPVPPATLLPIEESWAVRYVTATPGRLEGQVLLSDTASLPGRVHVVVSLASGGRRVIDTPSTGVFAFDSLPLGRHHVFVRRVGYRGWTGMVTMPADSGVRLVTMLAFHRLALCPVRLAP